MEQYLALRASAGSGKTFNLAVRYIYLLCKGANPYEILTLTFTNKAANEMRHRISTSLKDLAQDSQHNCLEHNKYFQKLHKEGISEDFIKENIAFIYKKFRESHTRITTLDSFFYTILQKFCWYVGVASDFEIGGYERGEIYELFLDSLSKNELQEFAAFCYTYFSNFNQKILGFLDILWCSNELEEVLEKMQYKDSHTQALQTCRHDIETKVAFLKQIITALPKISQSGINAFKYDNIESLLSKKWVLDGSKYRFFTKLNLSYLDSEFEDLRELLVKYVRLKEREIFVRIYNYIERFKKIKNIYLRQNNVLRYDDITYKVLELLYKNRDRAFFYFRLDDKITHILLDEFQDTSIVQYKILTPLIDEILSGDGRIENRSVFVVGDNKQSIYSFRGGFSEVFDVMAGRLSAKELYDNFRSSKVIVDFINETFSKVYTQYTPQIPKKDNGYVDIRYINNTKESEVKEEIKNLIYESVCMLLQKGVPQENIAILTFTNDEVEVLRDYLKMRDSKIQIVAETSHNFFDIFPCNVLINALRYAQTKNILYKRNIAKILGFGLLEEIALPEDRTHCGTYVYEVIESLHLGCAMSAQFLEQACAYESIEEFLDAYFYIDVNVPKESLRGIRIMTIHKSKGLEFPYLIVSDSLTKTRSSSDKILSYYEGINLQNIYYKIKGREHLDATYAKALEMDTKTKEREKINQLYVAFTRAEQSLMVICRQESSCFDILGLTKQNLGKLEPPLHTLKDSQTKIKTFVSLPALGTQMDFSKVEQEPVSMTQRFSLKAIAFGKALHSYFEYLLKHWHKDIDSIKQSLYITQMQDIAHNLYGFVLDTHALKSVQERFIATMEDVNFRNLLQGCEIYTEVSYLSQGRFYRIDALLYNDKKYIVLDYKSSHLPQDEHFKQVREYVSFLTHISHQCVEGYLIYPAKSQICVALP